MTRPLPAKIAFLDQELWEVAHWILPNPGEHDEQTIRSAWRVVCGGSWGKKVFPYTNLWSWYAKNQGVERTLPEGLSFDDQRERVREILGYYDRYPVFRLDLILLLGISPWTVVNS